MDKMDWVDKIEQKNKEDRSKEYFNIEEGAQKFVLLSYCEPLAQVWNNTEKKYEIAEEGDKNISIKGICWVLQDEMVKLARLPYTVVKAIRALQNDPEWEFIIPFPHVLTLTATNAGTKEVEYTLTASPKEVHIPEEVIHELKKKPTPEEMVEKMKGKKVSQAKSESEMDPGDVPFYQL